MNTAIAYAPADEVSKVLEQVNQIDLSPINQKLQYENQFKWNQNSLKNAEKTYRRFLALHKLYPSISIVPNKIIDEYWHQHILDTRKYAQDCENLFGEMLHHDPYFGINGEEDKARNLFAFEQTKELWEKAFGEPLIGRSNPCKSTDCR